MASTHWHEIPFVRISIPFIVGILTEQVIGGIIPLALGISLTLVLSLINLVIKTGVYKQQLRTAILLTLMFSIGLFVRKSAEPSGNEIQLLASYDGLVDGVVRSAVRTDYGYKAKLSIVSPKTQDPIKVMVYLKDSSIALLPCDTLVFQGGLQTFSPPANPHVFDAEKYYRRQGIQLRRYLDSTELLAFQNYQGGLQLFRKSAQIREKVKTIFQSYVHQAQSCAVLLAMTVGVVDGLDDSIYEAYAKSGAIHILAISGLHVGIVSAVLFLIVGRARSTDKLYIKFLRAAILLGGIWAFAFIAGLSPSITRAALMSSIYFVGTCMGRQVKGLNVLGFTAFICLCVDPLQINSLSFQFSYLALLGILIFFKPLYNLLVPMSLVGKFIWGTIVMSVAAQAFLIPLLIHYFNQVSIISLLSSLVAIPASYGILIGGIFLLLLHYLFPIMADMLGQGLDIGIGLVNEMIIAMSEFPMSYLANVYLPPIEVAILSVTTVLIALRILTQSKKCTYAAMLAVGLFGILHTLSLQQSIHDEMLAIYPSDDTLAIDFISGGNCFTTFNADSMPAFRKKEIASFRNSSRAQKTHQALSSSVTSNTVHVLELPGYGPESSCLRVAVITHSARGQLNSDLLALQADWIILSSGLNFRIRRVTEEFCNENRIQFHDLREHGTFYLAKHKNNNSNETQWQNIPG